MERIRKTVGLLAVLAIAAAAHSAFAPAASLCIATGTTTYRLMPAASSPDYRIRIDNTSARPDLRMQVVDRPEIADFVLADDFGAPDSSACRSSVPVKTIRVDADVRHPDVVVHLSADPTDPDYKVYVHSIRFSHQDAAALLAAMWKAKQTRRLAERTDARP
jgi:hypothetical protein